MKIKHPFVLIFLVAAIPRALWLLLLPGSPVAALNFLPGLDMMTHLELGELFTSGQGIYTHYRLLVGLCGGNVYVVALIQYLIGIATALLTGYVALRLWRRPLYTFAAGAIAGLYNPAWLYESLMLQEILGTFLTFVAIPAFLYAHHKKYSNASLILAAVAIAAGMVGRPIGLLWEAGILILLLFQLKIRQIILVLAVAAAVLLPVSLYNRSKGSVPLPFYGGNLAYVAEVGGQSDAVSLDGTGKQVDYGEYLISAGKKIPMLFAARQLPNNVNYYFIRENCDLLKFGITPLWFYIAGVSGMIFMILRRRLSHFEGMLLFYFAALSLPLLIFQPLGRYRLFCYPVLALTATYLVIGIVRLYPKPKWSYAAMLIVAAAIGFAAVRVDEKILRITDYLNWGVALQRSGDGPQGVKYFKIAFDRHPEHRRAALLYANALAKEGKTAEADQVMARHSKTVRK